MKRKLKIVIFDGSLRTTTFINRLAQGLSKKQKVYIIGFNNAMPKKQDQIRYVDLGSSANFFNLIWQSKKLSLKYFLKTGNLIPFLKTIKNIIGLNKKRFQQDNFNITLLLIQPDIIHIQWPSLIPWCEEELRKGKYHFILSHRGYQSNVRPFVDKENFNYLQNWYPKFAGFHSVSKAISKEGDKIHPSLFPFKGGIKKIDKVVYSGFDFKKLPFIEKYEKGANLQILSVGRPHWIKGYAVALKACSILKDKGIEFTYTIVGATELNEEILYLIDDYGLQKQVNLIPKIPQEEVYVLMKQSSILLFPSLMEGLPNVVVEAMAVGLPVLSTKCGGVEELVEHHKTGWLVPTRNSDAIVNAILEFTETPLTKIEEIRLAARRKVEAQHREEQMIAGMEQLYQDVIGEGSEVNR